MCNSLTNCHVVVLVMMVANTVMGIKEVELGVILDLDSDVGKSSRICMLMALEDVYGAYHSNFTTNIRCHFRDSKHDNYVAAFAVIDLIKNTQVVALLGPQQSSQANFVLDIAKQSKVPIISTATSPDLSSKQNPYFIRIAQSSSTQAKPIAALIKSFGWTEVVFVSENTEFGRALIPYLFDAIVKIGAQVKYQAILSSHSTDDSIIQQLEKLKTMRTRVFVVHMLPPLASRFFKLANEVGMMAEGYAWIITDVVTGLLHRLDPRDLDSMQGVVGVKPYIPPSTHLTKFERKWRRRVLKEYPETDMVDLDMFGIWSYDFVFALATALHTIKNESITLSEMRSKTLAIMQNIRHKGLSGDFNVVHGQLQTLSYQIVNVLWPKGEKHVGLWNSVSGLSHRIRDKRSLDYTTSKDHLGVIIWPGDTPRVPLGWDNKKLRVGVPVQTGFTEFFVAYRDLATNTVYANGFCMNVFDAVIDAMPHVVNFQIIPYDTPDGKSAGNVDDLVYQISLGKFDMVAGPIDILSNRTNYVDFTFPFFEEGIAMVVPVKVDNGKNAWSFMKPLEMKLWIIIVVFFIYTSFVVWVCEHRKNIQLIDGRRQQIGTILWFSLSTLVFAHVESLTSNLSRFVVIVWVFVLLVLGPCYTATLSSILTNNKLQPTLTNIHELIRRGDYVGYHADSFVKGLLEDFGVPGDKLKKYNSIQEYHKALSDGSKKNGVSAIVDVIPFLKLLQRRYSNKYIIVGPTYKTAGMGFAFPKGSPHVDTFSRAIIKVIEGQMRNISDKWLGKEGDINSGVQTFDELTFASFQGLFFIAGLSSTCALAVYIVMFLHEYRSILVSNDSMFQKMVKLKEKFNERIQENENEVHPPVNHM